MPWEITDWFKNTATSTINVSSVDVAEIPGTGVRSWSGYEVIKDEENNTWIETTEKYEGLPALGYSPFPNKIYNEDATIYVGDLRTTVNIPINQENLVFYADFNNNSINHITGIRSDYLRGTYEKYLGLNCIKLVKPIDNSYDKSVYRYGDSVAWSALNKFPETDLTFVLMVSPISHTSYWSPLIRLLDT